MTECKNCKCGIIEGEYCVHCAGFLLPPALLDTPVKAALKRYYESKKKTLKKVTKRKKVK